MCEAGYAPGVAAVPAPVSGDTEALYERLAAAAPVCGSCLEPLLNGFVQDASFRQELQEFVAARAPQFSVVCEDGSHPLTWTTCHMEYKEIFERQMHKVLQTLGMTGEELTELCGWLQANHGHGFIYDDGLSAFLEAVTVSEDYHRFLEVVFSEVGRQAGEEIEVAVPDGLGPGQAFRISYLGTSYELVVPENCAQGDIFRAAVTRPANLDMVSLFNVPDSFYGLD
eukprot:TRINITY_DN44270_c0_g1_i1.p1 TRINITY_DN44270_c0_g1~~TRINITY_DN44270_c0_g1_i1.p1  ORF type:complete len:234 (-),score=49.09 TRINITY_DN44270_c0_g1_i1:25-702(-)